MPATLADIQDKYGENMTILYKDQMHEPYTKTEFPFGYKGVVLYNSNTDKVLCPFCGTEYKLLNSHIIRIHKLSLNDYKEVVGINKGTPIQAKSVSEKQSITTKKTCSNPNNHFGKGWKNKQTMIEAHKKASADKVIAKYYKSETFKNKFGLCDSQIATRLQIVADIVKRSPTQDDIKKYDSLLLRGIYDRYKNLNNCKTKLGYKINIGGTKLEDRYTDTSLLSILREFVLKNKIMPHTRMTGKDKEMPSWVTYRAHFGSWNAAIKMAGLDQLLTEVKI